MMMPANFSAISENEMTYVNGGAVALEDILAPRLTLENWQKFNTNMVTLIGNKFLGSYVNNTVGTLFSGAYKPGNLGRAWFNSVAGAYNSGVGAVTGGNGPDAGMTLGNPTLGALNGALNVGLRLAGSAAAIYNLATGTVKNAASESTFVKAGAFAF